MAAGAILPPLFFEGRAPRERYGSGTAFSDTIFYEKQRRRSRALRKTARALIATQKQA